MSLGRFREVQNMAARRSIIRSHCKIAAMSKIAAISACALGAAPCLAAGQSMAHNTLQDVQIGESGRLMRIALICSVQRCDVAADGQSFLLNGVNISLEIDLEGRSNLANAIVLAPGENGSRLNIGGPSAPIKSAVRKCVVSDEPAACIDLEFATQMTAAADTRTVAAPDQRAAAPAPEIADAQSEPSLPPPPEVMQAALKDGPRRLTPEKVDRAARVEIDPPAEPPPADPPIAPVEQRVVPPILALAKPATAKPALREAPGREQLVLAGFEAPERFAPPRDASATPSADLNIAKAADTSATGAQIDEFSSADAGYAGAPQPDFAEPHIEQAALTKPSPEFSAPRPSIIRRDKAAALLGPDFDFAEQVEKILAKNLEVGACEGAKARLRDDAWALDAMIDAGLCKAAKGDLEAAETDLKRLLSYTPDNYEALVGRALIAAKAGEKSVARKYFQDALNALPPIEESNRIVEAMDAL